MIWTTNGILQAILAMLGAKASWFSYFCVLAALLLNLLFDAVEEKRKDAIYKALDQYVTARVKEVESKCNY